MKTRTLAELAGVENPDRRMRGLLRDTYRSHCLDPGHDGVGYVADRASRGGGDREVAYRLAVALATMADPDPD